MEIQSPEAGSFQGSLPSLLFPHLDAPRIYSKRSGFGFSAVVCFFVRAVMRYKLEDSIRLLLAVLWFTEFVLVENLLFTTEQVPLYD